ncbi:MAG: hypothetical protein EWV53_08545 [Microcystis panniformis Mp_MB_F_20051200_S9]|uniref:Uncharacterized protein n=1 Tax=Microcystis panniformis Mp_MB_F_20051200_S9 TaxID=2486223 RepID=A0A552Q2I6_9CHRO|nr:MAG: hypothetical protein EWV87_15675 [Microcystis panniformis Mp_GB_SS_20050300_S99]TRV48810.1 MAG: hypothetical protein EWV43_09815 [Microcystis panniformis Mp_MB_F_20080800_S26D]TRV48935.1 MAG: hypothetical protein EWV42_13865 [Microcystis panniformis Mp_GB_SS_20050300_S99D]TRV63434.1 MAG: hypothetical protein EWV53_08545 [Microcystis panniformis Mp_MB_F_20051200_S9]TRV63954.1 MAG: hypothetical protein EWV69_02610 [Microcystis panniformis Mp_MB_F_20080800_S26]TRV66152.1 MAG: hypothetical
MRIISIYLRDSNTSSDSGIILHYAMVVFCCLFWNLITIIIFLLKKRGEKSKFCLSLLQSSD